jgi:DNA-binding CsgD family transcriptional regulator
MKKGTGRVDPARLAELWAQGKTCQQIGDEFGCSAPHISNLAKLQGLPRRLGGHLKKELPGLAELVARGMTQREMAEHYNCSETTVGRHVELLGLQKPRQEPEPDAAPARMRGPSAAAKPEPDTATLTGRLLATKGRYAALDELRRAEGWTSTQALQRYHQAARAGA